MGAGGGGGVGGDWLGGTGIVACCAERQHELWVHVSGEALGDVARMFLHEDTSTQTEAPRGCASEWSLEWQPWLRCRCRGHHCLSIPSHRLAGPENRAAVPVCTAHAPREVLESTRMSVGWQCALRAKLATGPRAPTALLNELGAGHGRGAHRRRRGRSRGGRGGGAGRGAARRVDRRRACRSRARVLRWGCRWVRRRRRRLLAVVFCLRPAAAGGRAPTRAHVTHLARALPRVFRIRLDADSTVAGAAVIACAHRDEASVWLRRPFNEPRSSALVAGSTNGSVIASGRGPRTGSARVQCGGLGRRLSWRLGRVPRRVLRRRGFGWRLRPFISDDHSRTARARNGGGGGEGYLAIHISGVGAGCGLQVRACVCVCLGSRGTGVGSQ